MSRKVMVELSPGGDLAGLAMEASAKISNPRIAPAERRGVVANAVSAAAAGMPPWFQIDTGFPPTSVPDPVPPGEVPIAFEVLTGAKAFDVRSRHAFNVDPLATPYIVRGEVATDEQVDALASLPDVRAVYADPAIQPCPVCPTSPPVGDASDVARLLAVDKLVAAGLDGRGVLLAIVDTGINLDHLRSRGLDPAVDRDRSWVRPADGDSAFRFAVDHGTMCAYDALIAAPRATLLDVAILRPQAAPQPGEPPVAGLLSDAVLAYSHLLEILRNPGARPGEAVSLVISNSWAIFNPAWDLPPAHPGNYTDNPVHPFNRIVDTLESFGADILFAAGNCGADCADWRCQWSQGVSTIAGANSHPRVLSVAGVDVTGARVGYSSTGPGRLADRKPDISGFTHFQGSGVYPADGGTSAACPVVAGVVAAVRSRLPASSGLGSASPAAVRDMLTKTALERGNPGFDYAYGWGIVNGSRLSELVPDITTGSQGEDTVEAVLRLEAEMTGTAPAEPDEVTVVAGPAQTIGGNAKSAKGTLKTGTLVVRRKGDGFTDSKPMTGTGAQLSASITVPKAGTYQVTIRVTAAPGTSWEGTASLNGKQKATSGPRETLGSSDQWPTNIAVS